MFLEIAASMVKHLSTAQPHQVLLVKLKEAMETIQLEYVSNNLLYSSILDFLISKI